MDEYGRRKGLTFAQAEGLEPLPTQLDRTLLTPQLRAALWFVLHGQMSADWKSPKAEGRWLNILTRREVHQLGHMVDHYRPDWWDANTELKAVFAKGDYAAVYGLVSFLIRDPECPAALVDAFQIVLEKHRSAYRIVGNDTLVPIASELEIESVDGALKALERQSGFGGTQRHVRAAAHHLSSGSFADSVRESIHAVESTARLIGNTGDLSGALASLEKSAKLHPAMRKAFVLLYAYTSDEGGIRHALLEDESPVVDETDAVFMLGACASFVSYLIGKSQLAKLLAPPSGT